MQHEIEETLHTYQRTLYRFDGNAEIYGRNQVELFWNQVPGVFPPISVEVFRDDELPTTTGNSFSFYDIVSSVTNEESRYRVRTVDEAGNVGQFSNEIVVNRVSLGVQIASDLTGVENPRTDGELRIQNLSVVAFGRFVDNNNSFVMTWSADNPTNVTDAGFEIRIDNEAVDFINSATYSGDGADINECRVFSVAAIADDGAILDYASGAFGNRAIQCPSQQ